jgi:hypothetical protein
MMMTMLVVVLVVGVGGFGSGMDAGPLYEVAVSGDKK